jgi:hypothetical protein
MRETHVVIVPPHVLELEVACPVIKTHIRHTNEFVLPASAEIQLLWLEIALAFLISLK